ncbi:MAG: hypothetical protein ACR2NY_04295 [Alphaproteobacteria bacterium]
MDGSSHISLQLSRQLLLHRLGRLLHDRSLGKKPRFAIDNKRKNIANESMALSTGSAIHLRAGLSWKAMGLIVFIAMMPSWARAKEVSQAPLKKTDDADDSDDTIQENESIFDKAFDPPADDDATDTPLIDDNKDDNNADNSADPDNYLDLSPMDIAPPIKPDDRHSLELFYDKKRELLRDFFQNPLDNSLQTMLNGLLYDDKSNDIVNAITNPNVVSALSPLSVVIDDILPDIPFTIGEEIVPVDIIDDIIIQGIDILAESVAPITDPSLIEVAKGGDIDESDTNQMEAIEVVEEAVEDKIIVSKPAEPDEPNEPNEPTEPAEPNEPTEPSEPAEPSEPNEPTEPSEPAEPTEPNEPTEPTEPAEPSEPTEPPDGVMEEVITLPEGKAKIARKDDVVQTITLEGIVYYWYDYIALGFDAGEAKIILAEKSVLFVDYNLDGFVYEWLAAVSDNVGPLGGDGFVYLDGQADNFFSPDDYILEIFRNAGLSQRVVVKGLYSGASDNYYYLDLDTGGRGNMVDRSLLPDSLVASLDSGLAPSSQLRSPSAMDNLLPDMAADDSLQMPDNAMASPAPPLPLIKDDFAMM